MSVTGSIDTSSFAAFSTDSARCASQWLTIVPPMGPRLDLAMCFFHKIVADKGHVKAQKYGTSRSVQVPRLMDTTPHRIRNNSQAAT